MTVAEALRRLERLYRIEGRACLRTFASQVKPILRAFAHRELAELTSEDLTDYVERRLEEGYARATLNHETAALARAWRVAIEDGLVEAPVPKIRRLRLDNARSGYLLPAEFRRLVSTLEVLDPVIADVVRLAYHIGWRRGEILNLRWEEVEEDRITLPSARSKNGCVRAVALTGELLDLLRRRRAAQDGPFVFHRGGRQVKTFRGSWRRAVKALGRPELTPHDLRRSFARNALQSGVPQPLIMTIGGWRTASVFRRYAIVDEGQVREALERVQSYCSGAGEASVWAPANSSRKKSGGGA